MSTTCSVEPAACTWPRKWDVLGVGVSATNYAEAVESILRAAQDRESAVVSLHPVHAIIEAHFDPGLRAKAAEFEMIAPDGQPIRWALNWLHGLELQDRVYGPELMLRLCAAAAERDVGVYLYGSSAENIDALREKLPQRFPRLRIVGAESPPYRPLTSEENEAWIERVHASGAGIVFIGLGCPKQDHFAHAQRGRLKAVQVCVGAAFDFHAGTKKMAPRWMQRNGLEWLFRLKEEPRRLWKRYLVTNSVFSVKLAAQLLKRGRGKQARSLSA